MERHKLHLIWPETLKLYDVCWVIWRERNLTSSDRQLDNISTPSCDGQMTSKICLFSWILGHFVIVRVGGWWDENRVSKVQVLDSFWLFLWTWLDFRTFGLSLDNNHKTARGIEMVQFSVSNSLSKCCCSDSDIVFQHSLLSSVSLLLILSWHHKTFHYQDSG